MKTPIITILENIRYYFDDKIDCFVTYNRDEIEDSKESLNTTLRKFKKISTRIFSHFKRNIITYILTIIAILCALIVLNSNFINNYIYSFSDFDASKLKNDGAIVNYMIARNTYGAKILTILAGFFGLLLAFWRSHNTDRNRQNDEVKEINERYTKTIELLGSNNEAVRIGALYSLEQICKESKKLYKPCLKIIESYITNEMNNPNVATKQAEWWTKFNNWKITYKKNPNSGYAFLTNIDWDFFSQPSWYLPEDLKVALNILSLNGIPNKINLQGLNFQGCNFVKLDFNFENLNLSGTSFAYSKFKNGFKFINCNLQDTDFRNAYLANTSFAGTHLARANFINALLQGSNFKKANLNATNFTNADAKGCRFTKAYLAYSCFYKADIGANTNFFKNVKFNQIIIDKNNFGILKSFIEKATLQEIPELLREPFLKRFALLEADDVGCLEIAQEEI